MQLKVETNADQVIFVLLQGYNFIKVTAVRHYHL